MREISLPLDEQTVRSLHAGDMVALSGVMITARDAAHKFFVEEMINMAPVDAELYAHLRAVLAGGAIYHCGPVVEQKDGVWRFTAAGPTTSMREECYESAVMEHFGVAAIVGKGGMGARTAAACRRLPAVYLHAPGGAAVAIARYIKEVMAVYKLEFGLPEAIWQIKVERMPLLVTMDAHGISLHEQIEQYSARRSAQLTSASCVD